VRAGPNAVLGFVVGALYLLVGAACSAVALGAGLASSPGHDGPGPAGAHCAAFLIVGALLVAAVPSGRARTANTLVGATYLGLGLALSFRSTAPQLLALHHPDAVAHLCAAALLLGFGRTQE
jgi:hypothetical protein